MSEDNKLVGYDLKNSLDEFYRDLLNPKIDILNLIFQNQNFHIEKSQYIETYDNKIIFFKELFDLKETNCNLKNIYRIKDGQDYYINEEILELAKHINIFGDFYAVTDNFLDELKSKFPNMMDESISSVRCAVLGCKTYLFTFYSRSSDSFNINKLEEFAETIESELSSDALYSISNYPLTSDFEDAEVAKYTLLKNTSKYLIAKFLDLFNKEKEFELMDGYEEYRSRIIKNSNLG